MKKYFTYISVILFIIAVGCTSQKPIGGQKDEHGCLGPAGYSWDKDIGACTRQWELDENQKKAAKIAVAPLSFPVTIIQVNAAKCQGCYGIIMERNDNQERITRTLINWEIAGNESDNEINSFEECANAGNPVTESYPRQCSNGGRTFTEESCADGKGNILTITDAKEIAKNSECGDNLIISCLCPQGYRQEGEACNPECYYSKPKCLQPSVVCEKSYVCNENTGTYWINLDIKKEGCNPACVINLETRTAEINWRCTGALPEEHQCTESDRAAEVCTTLYKPVCGWFDSKQIQCFAYPCADTYSNSCNACIDSKVAYWTEGECPKP